MYTQIFTFALFASATLLASFPKALDCYSQVVQFSEWTSLERHWGESFFLQYRNGMDRHLQSLCLKSDCRVTDRQKLGFTFEGELKAPSLDRFVENVRKEVEWQIKNGLIQERDAIRPSWVFWDPEGRKLHFLNYGETPAPHWKVFPNGTIPSEVVLEMIDNGFFPITGTAAVSVRHDVAHMLAFLKNPDLTAKFRELVRHYKVDQSLTSQQKLDRFNFLLETFSWVPARHREKLRALLSPAFAGRQDMVSVQESMAAIQNLSREEYSHLEDRLVQSYLFLGRHFNGVGSDITPLYNYADSGLLVGEASLTYLAARVAFLNEPGMGLHVLRNLRRERMPRSYEERIKLTARLEVALWASTFIHPIDFIEAMKHPVEPGSPVYQMYIGTGLGTGFHWGTADIVKSFSQPPQE